MEEIQNIAIIFTITTYYFQDKAVVFIDVTCGIIFILPHLYDDGYVPQSGSFALREALACIQRMSLYILHDHE